MARTKRRATKGTGQVVRRGRKWGIRYTERGVRRFAGGYLTEDHARQALAQVTAEIAGDRPPMGGRGPGARPDHDPPSRPPGKVDLPKSGKGRVVDMVPALADALRDWRARNRNTEVVCPQHRAKDSEKVRHLDPKRVQARLDEALMMLHLPALTWYQAGRHTFASHWVLNGIDIYRLSKILGHAAVTTTERYAHLTARTPPEVLARANISLIAQAPSKDGRRRRAGPGAQPRRTATTTPAAASAAGSSQPRRGGIAKRAARSIRI